MVFLFASAQSQGQKTVTVSTARVNAGATVTTETVMTGIPAVRQLFIGLELALSDLKAVARYARRILKRRRAKGLTVAAITDGNEFGISSGSPGDGAAVTGSVDLHNVDLF